MSNYPQDQQRPGQAAAPVIVRFELYEDLETGGSAEAKVLHWNGADEEFVSRESPLIEVHDAFERFSADEGAKGLAKLWHDAQRWEVLILDVPDGLVFRNDSGEEMPAYGLGKITGNTQVAGKEVLTADKPDDVFQRLYLVNGGAAVANGELGTGEIWGDGMTALINGSGTIHGGAGAKQNQWSLEPSRPGFTVLGTVAAGVVRVQQSEVVGLWGELAGTLTVGGTCDVTVHMDGAAVEYTIVAKDKLLLTGKKLESGVIVFCEWQGDRWWITQSKTCPVPV